MNKRFNCDNVTNVVIIFPDGSSSCENNDFSYDYVDGEIVCRNRVDVIYVPIFNGLVVDDGVNDRICGFLRNIVKNDARKYVYGNYELLFSSDNSSFSCDSVGIVYYNVASSNVNECLFDINVSCEYYTINVNDNAINDFKSLNFGNDIYGGGKKSVNRFGKRFSNLLVKRII